ncbi:MAG: 30S ribosome-binding factor RbfA [Alphaproteobacteria bacterium]|nr:30S ribosome-binding factor RbfA [Alphaproteobacteria bacterium]
MTRHRDKAAGPRTAGQRQLRVGEELRHALAGLLARGDLRDPVLAAGKVTVTEVSASPDLRNATAYVMPLGGVDRAETLAALRRAAPYLRRQVAAEVRLRHMPNLTFEIDTSFDAGARIDALIGDRRGSRGE